MDIQIAKTPMTFDGEEGYFISEDEYALLYAAASGKEQDDFVENLQCDNMNFRNAINDAYAVVSKLKYDLGNV